MSDRTDAEIEQERIQMQKQLEIERVALDNRKRLLEAEAQERAARARLRGGQ